MEKVILITGGAASGKSRWAISYFSACDNVLYMCTGKKIDKDTQERIKFSNEHNSVEWEIAEDINNPVELITEHKFFIFDNLASYTSNVIHEMCTSPELMTDELKILIEKRVIGSMNEVIEKVTEQGANLIIITIEAGFSVCPLDAEQVAFREILGAVNQRIANVAADVYLSASGIQFKIK